MPFVAGSSAIVCNVMILAVFMPVLKPSLIQARSCALS